MKLFFVLLTLSTFCLSAGECGDKTKAGTVYKGRLEVQGPCMNYTVRLLEGNMDTSMIMAEWKREGTDIVYHNVFGIDPCSILPAGIKQGDEFYFTLDTATRNCAVCMVYFPTPEKKLQIKAIDK